MRLDKFVSYTLNLTRKEAKDLIKHKEIIVNGKVNNNPDYNVDLDNDKIIYDDEELNYKEHIYIMMNKPVGYLSATFDANQKTVLDLIDEYTKYNLFIIGRLDIDACGLLILTNDGALAHEVTSPKSKIPKTYYVEVDGEFEKSDIDLFSKGMIISDGKGEMFKTEPAKLEIIAPSKAYITITEGKFHQVKNMCKKVGKEVTFLKRKKIGELELDANLNNGEYRLLEDFEVDMLKKTHII